MALPFADEFEIAIFAYLVGLRLVALREGRFGIEQLVELSAQQRFELLGVCVVIDRGGVGRLVDQVRIVIVVVDVADEVQRGFDVAAE